MNPAVIHLIDLVWKGVERFFPDKSKADEARAQIAATAMSHEFQLTLAQLEVNKAEAQSSDPYTSRWRPTVGYVIAAALAFQYVLNPLLMWGAAITGSQISVPQIGLDDHLWELMAGMLGLAGWRTLDKIKGGR